jgi:hypothetical protein
VPIPAEEEVCESPGAAAGPHTAEPTLMAAARSQMIASSPRGTFSQAELAGNRVITRCITRSMSVPGAVLDMKGPVGLRRTGPSVQGVGMLSLSR